MIPRPKWNDGEGEQGRTPTQLSWHVFGNDTDLELARMPWRSKQALDQQGDSAGQGCAAAGELTRQEPEQAALTANRVWTYQYANKKAEDRTRRPGRAAASWSRCTRCVCPSGREANVSAKLTERVIQAQEQWDNRTAPKIHEAFSQIWDQEELRVSRDRVSINPPALDKDAAKESQVAFGLHFDTGFQYRISKIDRIFRCIRTAAMSSLRGKAGKANRN